MKLCIIAGSIPPEACGVGDFTAALARLLADLGVEVVVLHRETWNLAAIADIVGAVRRERPDIVHLAYPTHGFRNSLVPHALLVALSGWKRVTTLHDYRSQHWIKRLSMSAFALGEEVILVGPDDLQAFRRAHPWMRRRTTMIPIGSAIPGGHWIPGGGDPAADFTIVHFGMLRPDKGIEAFLDLARLAHAAGHGYRMRFIGAVLPHARAYADSVFRAARDLPIDWHLDAPPDQVSELLRTSHVAYLPPPGGVHERRSTLLAVALNGVPIIATVGAQTPDALRPYLLQAADPEEALAIVAGLHDPGRLAQQSVLSFSLSQKFSWTTIAGQYVELFTALAARSEPSRRPARCTSA